MSLSNRLKSAKARALYWSGCPSFSGYGVVPQRTSRNIDMEYELALSDIDAISALIEKETGRTLKRYDPRERYRLNFLKRNSTKGTKCKLTNP